MRRGQIRGIILGIVFFVHFLNLIYGQQVISWEEAHKYYGKYVTAEGAIVATHNSGKACFLNFHPDYRRYFSVVIFSSDFHKFPGSPETYYLNKKVKVTGLIREYQGKPEVILRDPKNIKIIGGLEAPKEAIEISWEDANRYYGQYCYVRGRIVATFNTGKACFLNFHKNWKRYFTAVIFASDFHRFPNKPENYYLNKEVIIIGTIREYQGKPEIIVNNPEQIKIIKGY